MGYKPEDFPASVEAAEETLALPIFSELTPAQIGYVVESVENFFM